MTVSSDVPNPPWLECDSNTLNGKKGGRAPGRGRNQRTAGPTGSSLSPLYKTRLCTFYADGACKAGPLCGYAHGEAELRQSPDFEKTSVCPVMLKLGKCTKRECRYAHESHELQVSPVMLKTKMCSYFLSGGCVVGEACRFAHSPEELREASVVQHERRSVVEQRRFDFFAKRDPGPTSPTGTGDESREDEDVPPAGEDRSEGAASSKRARRDLVRSHWSKNTVPPPKTAQGLVHLSNAEFCAIVLEQHQEVASQFNEAKAAAPPPPGLLLSDVSQIVDVAQIVVPQVEQPNENHRASSRVLTSLNTRNPEKPQPATSRRKVTVTDRTEMVEIIEVDDDIEAVGSAAVVEAAGRVVVSSTASAAQDCLEGFLVDCEDIAWRSEAAVRTLAGVGAAVLLQRRTGGATTTSGVLDIEDLNEIGNFCESCELGDDSKPPIEVRRRPKSVTTSVDNAGDGTSANHASGLRGRSCGRRAWQKEQSSRGIISANFGGCALCDKGRPLTGEPCAACNCGLRVVSKNTFLELLDVEEEEVQMGARRRCKSAH